MKRFVSFMIALVVALLAPTVTAGAAPPDPTTAATYDYDNRPRAAPTTDTTSERGPPAPCDHDIPHDAVDLPSHGVSARSNGPSRRYAYDLPALLVHDGCVRTLTGDHAVAADGIISSLQRTGVAANGGSTLARTCLRSFAGTTLVLMADGSRKPIEDIEAGDKVIATYPQTGERVTRQVTRVWVHDDQLLDLVVDGDVITTTEDHLFWSVTDQTFKRADQLSPGEVVLGDGGRQITVSGFRPGSERTALAYNLSIAGVHTYHVGVDEIVVHKDCGDFVDLTSPKRRNHILNGDKTGGGHRSEFPAGWSDDRIMHEISDIATAPGVPWRPGKFTGQRIYTRGGIDVLTDANGNIISAWVP